MLAAVAALAGLTIGWFVGRMGQQRHLDTLKEENGALRVDEATLNERIAQAESRQSAVQDKLAERDARIESLNREISTLRSSIAELNVTLEKERQAAAEKLGLLDEARQRLADEFKLLANQIFEEKGKKLSEQSRSSLDEVLKPVREQLGEFRKRVDDIHTHDAKDRASLREYLQQLERLNQKISEDALNLTQALKGESKAQGNWGEMILERLLESSGLREGKEFAREQSFTTEDGRRLRPDVVVYMPGDKQVIIDSKVSLTDYERAVSADGEADRKSAVAAHVRSLKAHIQALAAKRYDHLPDVHSPDYILMFVPIEGAYMMAIEADQAIFETAFEQGVAVVTPSTLYATLKLIEHLWRYERQSENVAKLIDRAGKLHDKVATFVESFEEIGQRLGQAQQAYDTSLNRIRSGPGNVISQIDMLGKLAGKTKKELPAHLLQSALGEEADDVPEASDQ